MSFSHATNRESGCCIIDNHGPYAMITTQSTQPCGYNHNGSAPVMTALWDFHIAGIHA